MGIDSINSVANATASYQTAAVKPAPVKAPEPVTEAPETVSNSVASDVLVINRAGSDEMQGSGNDAEKQSKKQQSSLAEAAKDINRKINNNTIAEFGYHEATRRITIKIKDKDTDEVIKEIPSEKALEMLEKAWEIAGILVDEKR
ncbi:MAG: flagellar protein FlaG [Lachnospiraceae bacterium]